ncbi:MAG: hypothetical protein ABSB28_09270 [Candidatus Bathyarchaeia archaeon]
MSAQSTSQLNMAIYKDTIKRKMVGHKPIQTVKFGYLVQSNYYHTSCHPLLGLDLSALG